MDSKHLSSQYFELPPETSAGNGMLEIGAGIYLKRPAQGIDAWKVKSICATIDLISENIQCDEQETDLYVFEKGRFSAGFTHYYQDNLPLFHGMCIVFYRYDEVVENYNVVKERHVNAGFLRFVETY